MKTCPKCNETKELTEFYPYPKYKGGYYRCKSCTKELSTKWAKDNQVKVRETGLYSNEWRKKKCEYVKEYRVKNIDTVRANDIRNSKRKVERLSDAYVKQLMRVKIDVPQELIEAKRLQILINRRIKNENHNNTTK